MAEETSTADFTHPQDVTPYTISVPQSLLDNLSAKLALRRLPVVGTEEDEADKDQGVSIADITRLSKYWEEEYDWRKQEAALNSIAPQFTTPITVSDETVKIHFLWSRSAQDNAVPLLLLHGWPSSPFEFGKIISELSRGVVEGSTDKSFHCVAPSLPGHAFSDLPKRGWGVMKIAECFHALMLKLGYTEYFVYGCDWGSLICRALAIQYPNNVLATHQNMVLTKTPSALFHTTKFIKLAISFITGGGLIPGTYSKREVENLKHVQKVVLRKEMGYNQLMSTKPATVSVGLTDSPVGLLAWIWEKLESWSDYEWSDDEILTWVMLYYIPGPFGGARLYKEYQSEREAITAKYCNVPLGVSLFEGDLFQLPDDFAGMVQPVKFFRRHEKGGHFPGYEQPEALMTDIREFVDIVLKK